MVATESELYQTIDIEKAFGVDLSNEPRLRQELGQAMLDSIRDRCEDDNKDIFGKPFQRYSKEYIESDTFKDFNKSASDRDMTLTGRMLEDIDFEDSSNEIKLLVTDNHGKAYNHQVGAVNPQRAWFGVNDKHIEAIKKDFSSDLERIKKGKSVRPKRSVVDLLATQQIEQQSTERTFADLFGASGIDFNLDDV